MVGARVRVSASLLSERQSIVEQRFLASTLSKLPPLPSLLDCRNSREQASDAVSIP